MGTTTFENFVERSDDDFLSDPNHPDHVDLYVDPWERNEGICENISDYELYGEDEHA